MVPVRSCPGRGDRLWAAVCAALVFAVHAALQPIHLVSHHGGAEEPAHLAAHAAGAHAEHGDGHDHGDGDCHHEEHDSGDHSGVGHLLEVVPFPGPVAVLDLSSAERSWPGIDLPTVHRNGALTRPVADPAPPRPPPRSLGPPRAPPIG